MWHVEIPSVLLLNPALCFAACIFTLWHKNDHLDKISLVLFLSKLCITCGARTQDPAIKSQRLY